jgi:hypothetical protein
MNGKLGTVGSFRSFVKCRCYIYVKCRCYIYMDETFTLQSARASDI